MVTVLVAGEVRTLASPTDGDDDDAKTPIFLTRGQGRCPDLAESPFSRFVPAPVFFGKHQTKVMTGLHPSLPIIWLRKRMGHRGPAAVLWENPRGCGG